MKGPDIIASIQFLRPEEGGRTKPLSGTVFKCPFEFQNEKFDCGLHLGGDKIIPPGAHITVPITFLFPGYVKPRLRVGSRFTLWERGTIASGIVEEILGADT